MQDAEKRIVTVANNFAALKDDIPKQLTADLTASLTASLESKLTASLTQKLVPTFITALSVVIAVLVGIILPTNIFSSIGAALIGHEAVTLQLSAAVAISVLLGAFFLVSVAFQFLLLLSNKQAGETFRKTMRIVTSTCGALIIIFIAWHFLIV